MTKGCASLDGRVRRARELPHDDKLDQRRPSTDGGALVRLSAVPGPPSPLGGPGAAVDPGVTHAVGYTVHVDSDAELTGSVG